MKKIIFPLIVFACCCGCSSNTQETDKSNDCNQSECGCGESCGCSSGCKCKG